MKFNQQTLLKLKHKRYSKVLKISQNDFTNVTQTDGQTLLKIKKT